MNDANSKKLFDRFPFYGKGNQDPRQTLMCFGFACGNGWFDILWRLSEAIEKELEKPELKEEIAEHKQSLIADGFFEDEATRYSNFEVIQVKEKFGGLRYYTNWATDKINALIDAAEKEAGRTCETCGKPGVLRGDLSWISVLCDKEYEDARKPRTEVRG